MTRLSDDRIGDIGLNAYVCLYPLVIRPGDSSPTIRRAKRRAIGRTQTNGPDDHATVARIQDVFALTPLTDWGGSRSSGQPFTRDPSVDMETPPLTQVDERRGDLRPG